MAARGFRRYDVQGWNRMREDQLREQHEQREEQTKRRKATHKAERWMRGYKRLAE